VSNRQFRLLLICGFLPGFLLLTQCSKDHFAFGKSTILTISQSQHDISAIQVIRDRAYACGGTTWNHGLIWESRDSGLTWQNVANTDKIIEDIAIDTVTGSVYACGQDGGIFYKQDDSTGWSTLRMDYSSWYRGMTLGSVQGSVFLVGGEGYKNGRINRIDAPSADLDSLYRGPNEMACIALAGQNTLLVAGIGYVLRSADLGQNWTRLDLTGEFFQDIQFVDDQSAYLLAASGKVYATTDAGLTWQKRSSVGKEATSIHFVDKNLGFACTLNGKLYKTTNGGNDWETAKDLPSGQWLTVFAHNQKVWLGGKNGMLVLLEG
jgi:photosystem II stability/assembly factor-like uncharacterized protein